MKKLLAITAATAFTAAGTIIPVTLAPAANACSAPVNVSGGIWGGVRESCLPDGSKYVCDRGWAPFVGVIENCFHAPKGHPRNP